MLKAGRITGAYGIKGWVRVHPLTEQSDDFLSFSGWTIQRSGRFESVDFVEGRRHGRGLVARIAGVDDRDAAEQLRGLDVWVAADELPGLAQGDYYWHQLVGLNVINQYDGADSLLGSVDYLLETGSNDVLVVKASPASIDDRERLIPYLPGSVVKEVDLQGGCITVTWHPDD